MGRFGAAVGAMVACALWWGAAMAHEPIVTVLKPFRGGAGGGAPYNPLLPDAAGHLYGVAYNGGVRNPNCLDGNHEVLGCGVIYQLTPPVSGKGYWTETVLHDFTGRPDGYAPDSPLITDPAGNFYGTAEAGGPLGGGTVYQLAPPASGAGPWVLTTLHAFGAAGDGILPSYGGVIRDSSGALYGTTMHGGPASSACTLGCGLIYKLTPPAPGRKDWTTSILYTFTGGADGGVPSAGVSFGPLGYLYGTASQGGTSTACRAGCGTVFALVPPAVGATAWTENTLVDFNGANGSQPMSRLMLQNGDFYSTTETGGEKCPAHGGCGTVFQLMPPAAAGASWTLNQLFRFDGGDGAFPLAAVSFDASGNLYGATYVGGSVGCQVTGYPVGCGTVYELVPPVSAAAPWTVSFVYRFNAGAGGANPAAGVSFYKPGVLTVTTTTGGQTAGAKRGLGTALSFHRG